MALAPLEAAIDLMWDQYLKLRAEGWEDLPTNFPKTFRPEWIMWHSLREFYQNCLDEVESLDIIRTAEGLEIRDTGRGVNIEDFIMRSKEKKCWHRGQFGEGLKIACIVCLRNGYPVMIYAAGTPGKVIKPVFVKTTVRPGLEVGLLHFLWREFPKERGTTVKIFNYRGDVYRDRVFQNVPRGTIVSSRSVLVCEEKYRENVMFDYPEGGPYRLYARDLYVSEWWKPALYSYNLWTVKLDPNRVGVKTDEMHLLWSDVRSIWSGLKNEEAVRKLFRNTVGIEEPSLIELDGFEYYGGLTVNWESRPVWKRVWDEMYGTKTCYYTTDEYARQADHQGWKVMRVPWQLHRTLDSIGVKSDEGVYRDYLMALRVPVDPEELTATQQRNLVLAYWLHTRIAPMYQVERGPVAPVKVVPYRQLEFRGEYMDGEVRLREDILHSEEDTIIVFVHEYAHHTCPECDDNTNEMDEEIRLIAWYIWRMGGERPTLRELYDMFTGQYGVTPKFRPTGRVPPVEKPPFKVGNEVKVVTGPFSGDVGVVTEVSRMDERWEVAVKLRDQPSPIWFPAYRLEVVGRPLRAPFFSPLERQRAVIDKLRRNIERLRERFLT